MHGIIVVLLIYLFVFSQRVLKPYLKAGRPKAKMKAYRVEPYIYIPQTPDGVGKTVYCLRGIKPKWWNKKYLSKDYVWIDDYCWDVIEVERRKLKNPFIYSTFNDLQLKALLKEKTYGDCVRNFV